MASAHSTYTSIIDHIDNGDLHEWGTKTPAPQIAIDYWRMSPDANLRDLFLNGGSTSPLPALKNHTPSFNRCLSSVTSQESLPLTSSPPLLSPPIAVKADEANHRDVNHTFVSQSKSLNPTTLRASTMGRRTDRFRPCDA
jgi:hypothetical protein